MESYGIIMLIINFMSCPDGLSEPKRTITPNSSLQPDLPSPSDFIPVVDSEHFVVVKQSAEQGVSERQYPQRLNRRPPTRYSI